MEHEYVTVTLHYEFEHNGNKYGYDYNADIDIANKQKMLNLLYEVRKKNFKFKTDRLDEFKRFLKEIVASSICWEVFLENEEVKEILKEKYEGDAYEDFIQIIEFDNFLKSFNENDFH